MSWEILRRPRFGKFGQKFARENCLDSIHDVVQVASKASSKFKAILVKDYITGERHVDWFIFSTFLDQFFRIPTSLKIKRYHQFRFSSEKPGFVFVRQWSSSPEEEYYLLKKVAHQKTSHTEFQMLLNPRRYGYQARENGIFMKHCKEKSKSKRLCRNVTCENK